jgi:hypothetical protein
MEMDFAKRSTEGIATGGLTTGIIGTALGAMNSGLFGNLFGGNNCCSENTAVTRYDLGLEREIVNKDMEIAYLRGRDAAKTDSLELYKYVDGRFRQVESQIAAQAVVNAQITANISCIQASVAALQGLTKTVIPIGNVHPEAMAKFNSWTAPTTTATTG